MVDHNHIRLRLHRLQLQPDLLLDRRKDPGHRIGIAAGLRLVERPPQREVLPPGKPGLIHHRPIQKELHDERKIRH